MAVLKHIHKLKKHQYKAGAVFFCILVDCHFKMEVPFLLGKESLCNICGKVFIMREYALKLTRPHCGDCGKREVKDADGKKHYVSKRSNQILASVADENVEDLRNRLQSITNDAEKDI